MMRKPFLLVYAFFVFGWAAISRASLPDMATPSLRLPLFSRLARTPSPTSIRCPPDLPAFDPSHRGDVIRCGYDRYLSADEINSR